MSELASRSAAPVALWLPIEVEDLDTAASFYTDRVGLSVVDSWAGPEERGVVLGAGRAFVELVEPGRPGPVPLAFQLASTAEVDAARFGGAEGFREVTTGSSSTGPRGPGS